MTSRAIEHGTQLRYRQGCRCSRCVIAEGKADEARTHGKISTYNFGCRCEACRTAAAVYKRRYRSLNGREPARRYPNGQPAPGEQYAWQDDAACRTVPLELFFPHGGSYDEAKQVCNDCPVRVACLQYALRTDQPDGVWGGLTFAERQRVLRKRQRAS